MKRVTSFVLAGCVLLAGTACKNDSEVGENPGQERQTTVETQQSKEEDDGSVKVRVRTPAGDFNVDVEHEEK